jgi:putative glycosyltransferase (TIGR04372 family)
VVIHIPIVLILNALSPIIKFRFGYFSSDRIGHFSWDLACAIAKKEKVDSNDTVDLYYLQGCVSNTQLQVLAKRYLNVNQYYKYLVYAQIALGMSKKILVPNRHKGGSRDILGIIPQSRYDIKFSERENKNAVLYLKKYGWKEGEKFVCINVRDSAYFNENKSTRHGYRNCNIDDFEEAALQLISLGYWVIRTGKEVEKPFQIKNDKLIDYAVDINRSDLLDIWLCKNCHFFVSTGTGLDSVADIFRKPIVYVNYLPIAQIISWNNSITTPKKLFWDDGQELSLSEHLEHNYSSTEKYQKNGIRVVDLTPSDISSAVCEMDQRLNNIKLTKKQIQLQNKFWSMLENCEWYTELHGYKNPKASFSCIFLQNNPDFLS